MIIFIAKAVEEIMTYRDLCRLETSFGNEHYNVGMAVLIIWDEVILNMCTQTYSVKKPNPFEKEIVKRA